MKIRSLWENSLENSRGSSQVPTVWCVWYMESMGMEERPYYPTKKWLMGTLFLDARERR